MSFVKLSQCASDSEIDLVPHVRPNFNHQNTLDRLREGSGRPPSFSMINRIRKDRKSIFKELGLDDDDPIDAPPSNHTIEKDFGQFRRFTTSIPTVEQKSEPKGDRERSDGSRTSQEETPSVPQRSSASSKPWYSKLPGARRPRIKSAASAPPPTMSSLSRVAMIALLIAVVLPGFSYYRGHEQAGADAIVVPAVGLACAASLETRENSPTEICMRWSHQTALLNGTLYVYGGQARTSSGQVNNTWNNYFLTLDLTTSWPISSPSLTGLPQPSGPPAVASGYLWNDYNNLYLYGGEFADNPYVEPAPPATWKYTISSQTWTEYSEPLTSAGNNSDGGGWSVQRAAEGAGLSVPELGMSWYFGGHLDLSTTPGWSNQIARVYLKSLLEFTHPGYTNDGVTSLASGTGAGAGGVYRNITQGGLQTTTGFPERADGVLVFVPGWGAKGVLIGLAGGTNDSFSEDLSTLDVYDIANSVWYHQQTTGDAPSVRVDPCAVIASAPDASSFQIYLYGGQNLLPYGSQIQYNDMYILSIPSFTWIKVDQAGSQPAARAGHTCNLRDAQMVVVGGYVGKSISCDSPGIYVFNTSSLEWKSSFTALSHAADLDPDNSVLAGSYGYTVPEAVAAVIGGDTAGGATATTPAAGPATGGPFATGKAPVFTVTDSGSTATITQWGPGSTSTISPVPGSGISSGDNSGSSAHASPGLVAAGVIAGFAGLAAGYLGYCVWLYRRQVRAYKSHLAVANRYSGVGGSRTNFAGLAAFFGRRGGKDSGEGEGAAGTGGLLAEKRALGHNREASSSTADSFAWVGPAPVDPKMLFDDPTPLSGSGSSGMLRPSPGHSGPYSSRSIFSDERGSYQGLYGQPSGSGSGSAAAAVAAGSGSRFIRSGSPSGGSLSSMENLIAGQEPSFFSVVMGPRRALRVVNGMEGDQ